MGAQTPKRLEQFTERYKHFDDPMGKYLYIVRNIRKSFQCYIILFDIPANNKLHHTCNTISKDFHDYVNPINSTLILLLQNGEFQKSQCILG